MAFTFCSLNAYSTKYANVLLSLDDDYEIAIMLLVSSRQQQIFQNVSHSLENTIMVT